MQVNGKEVDYEADVTVEELLNRLELQQDKVVVEVDEEIVSKDEYSIKKLTSESKVEIIRFVGGG
jgi:sulfur carrier protein